jgi:hypothetical protein
MLKLNSPDLVPDHVECFEPVGPYGVWDAERGDWIRGLSGDIRSFHYFDACREINGLDPVKERLRPREFSEET